MGKLDTGSLPFAVVGIDLPVAAANGLNKLRTGIGYRQAVPVEVVSIAELVGQLAELTLVAGLAKDSATGAVAFPGMEEGNAALHPFAVVAVGNPIATTDGLIVVGTDFGPGQAHALAFVAAHFRRQFTEHAFVAFTVPVAAMVPFTGTKMIEANTCPQQFAFV
jgi:hypothetical protein